jgi:hypothetical protein
MLVLQIGKANVEARHQLPTLANVTRALGLVKIRRFQVLAADLDQIVDRQLVLTHESADLIGGEIAFFELCEVHGVTAFATGTARIASRCVVNLPISTLLVPNVK